MPSPRGHRRKRIESLQARHIDAKGEVTIAHLQGRCVRAGIAADVECLYDFASLDTVRRTSHSA